VVAVSFETAPREILVIIGKNKGNRFSAYSKSFTNSQN
jgi:hypothetical protein